MSGRGVRGPATIPFVGAAFLVGGVAGLAGVAVAGCEAEAGSESQSSVRDSAGVRIVELGALSAPAELVLDPLWTVEAIDGEPLHDMRGARFLHDGRVGVVEGSSGGSRLRLLDAATGEHLLTVGSAGDGPGEFGAPRGVVETGDGGLAVWDTRPRRLTRWDADGVLLGSEPLPDLGIIGIPEIRPAGGGLWIWLSSQLGPPVQGAPLSRDEGVLAFWSGSGVDTVTRFPGLEYVANGSIVGAPAWGDRSFSAAHPEGIWLGDTDEPAVRLFDREGLARIVRWTAEPTPRTAEDDAAFLAAIEAYVPPGAPPEVLDQARGMLVVERMPYWGRMIGDDEGGLWITTSVGMGLPPEVTGPVPSREWVVLGPDGVPTATVRTPEGFEPAHLRDGVLVGVERDPLGVERLRAFRVVAPG